MTPRFLAVLLALAAGTPATLAAGAEAPYAGFGYIYSCDNLDGLLFQAGKVGASDLGGDVDIDAGGERPVMKAALVSKLLDLDDLAGFIGATPETGGKKTQEQQKKAQDKQQKLEDQISDAVAYGGSVGTVLYKVLGVA